MLGLFAALIAPSFSGAIESTRLRSGAADVRATLSRTRTLAAYGARERAAVFDLAGGEYGIEGEPGKRALPAGVRFQSARVGSTQFAPEASAPVRIRFFPDGSGDESALVLSSPGAGSFRITVEPLTGVVEASS